MSSQDPIVKENLIAHRGASAYAPENTLEAIRLAAKMGAKWIETDVQLTADGHLVMIHDAKLDRTTNGSGLVVHSKLADIVSLDSGTWFSADYKDARTVTLEDYLTTILEEGLNLQLELKEMSGLEEPLVEATCAVVKKHWPIGENALFLSGFSERCMRLAAKQLPDVPRGLATAAMPRDPKARLEETDCQILHLQASFVSEQDMERLCADNIEFAIATVNDPDQARYFLERGAQSVLSDRPDLFS